MKKTSILVLATLSLFGMPLFADGEEEVKDPVSVSFNNDEEEANSRLALSDDEEEADSRLALSDDEEEAEPSYIS